MNPNPFMNMQQPNQPQLNQQQVNDHHDRLSDFQADLKQLIELPDDELSISKILGMAADLVSKNSMSQGKRGASAAEVASELSSPDFPQDNPGGQPPAPQAIRKFLINHYMKSSATQAALTNQFGPPMKQPMQTTPNQLMGG